MSPLSWLRFGYVFSAIVCGANAIAGPTRDLCPETCRASGPDLFNWTVVADFAQLSTCSRPLLVSFSVFVPTTQSQLIRACNIWAKDFKPKANVELPSNLHAANITVDPMLSWTPSNSGDPMSNSIVTLSIDHIRQYLNATLDYSRDRGTIIFATVSQTTVGIYVGASLSRTSVLNTLIEPLLSTINRNGISSSKSAMLQSCESLEPDQVFGLIAAATPDFATVQAAVRHWSEAKCVSTGFFSKTLELGNTTVGILRPGGKINLNATQSHNSKSTMSAAVTKPKKKSDGSCFAYRVIQNDNCYQVAADHGLSLEELKKFNDKKTWGWNGCGTGFWAGNIICLSDGTPPFPSSIANAVCGPQKPGTKRPKGSTSKDWSELNPCPINACCNIWGQCGTTNDFCIDTNTGAPGSARVGTYGCISNCGNSIIKGSPPSQFMKLGYFEGFNLDRDCLNMDASQIDSSYTHVHFAFGIISPTFNLGQNGPLANFQFEQFKKLKGTKRIISFGGWTFSAEAPNYKTFRNGVKEENREKLATNLVNYVAKHGLDGLDIDWEYPSAPDIPGIPAGDPSEAGDYLELLKLIRKKLPKGKTLSIAAPASYWYLKQFPIKKISDIVDYIVYMTYDIHGQWDAGNLWASPGCPTGNCLRSHVNLTETVNALIMITKADVPANKVLVGVTSYGRSFQMADPSCTGPTCLFTGDRATSNARKGRCTKEAGYMSNAEIFEQTGHTSLESTSNSNIWIDKDLWVSYMDDNLKTSRTAFYKKFNFGGTSDWALDLLKYRNPPSYDFGDQDLGISWKEIKVNLKAGRQATCDRTARSGNWININCGKSEALGFTQFTPEERWKALECSYAWKDLKRRWLGCRDGEDEGVFGLVASEFLHGPQDTKCGDYSSSNTCASEIQCHVWNKDISPDDTPLLSAEYYAGAGAFLVWNSFVAIHNILVNYIDSLKDAGDELQEHQDEFIDTFAPERGGLEDLLEAFLGALSIPMGIGVSKFLGSSFVTKAFFGSTPSDTKKELLDEAVSGLVDMGWDVATEALKSAAESRTEVAFNDFYKNTIKAWGEQAKKLLFKLFDGSVKSLKALDVLLEDGKMITGKSDADSPPPDEDYSETWRREKAIQRSFYAVAIPGAWSANKPAPVIADFGEGCDPEAMDYFDVPPSTYNHGWACVKGRAYILAGVRDGPQDVCGTPIQDGPDCPATPQWTFDMLPGIKELQEKDNPWGGITVDDLIRGALNTYYANGKKNVMNVKEALDPRGKTFFDGNEGQPIDVQTANFIRIPVCSPEEATKNLHIGRKNYGDSLNWPCDE